MRVACGTSAALVAGQAWKQHLVSPGISTFASEYKDYISQLPQLPRGGERHEAGGGEEIAQEPVLLQPHQTSCRGGTPSAPAPALRNERTSRKGRQWGARRSCTRVTLGLGLFVLNLAKFQNNQDQDLFRIRGGPAKTNNENIQTHKSIHLRTTYALPSTPGRVKSCSRRGSPRA